MGDLRHLGCNDETGCSRSLKRTIFSRRASNVPSNSIPPDRIDSHSSILSHRPDQQVQSRTTAAHLSISSNHPFSPLRQTY